MRDVSHVLSTNLTPPQTTHKKTKVYFSTIIYILSKDKKMTKSLHAPIAIEKRRVNGIGRVILPV